MADRTTCRGPALGSLLLVAAFAACISPNERARGGSDAAAGSGGHPSTDRDGGTDGDGSEAATSGCHAASADGGGPPSVSLGIATDGPPGGPPYDGPAIVERTASDGLVLAFFPASSTTADGGAPDAGAAAPLPRHATIHGLGALPALPLGARVWLHKPATGNVVTPPFHPPRTYFTVRDKQDGRLLFGTWYGTGSVFAPLTFQDGPTSCTGPWSDGCASGTAVYQTTVVRGDTEVTIADGETRTVRAAGVDYDLTILSKQVSATSINCSDYLEPYDNGFTVSLRAKDLAPLLAGLEVGAPIACAPANDEIQDVPFSFSGFSSALPFSGAAFYVSRRLAYGDQYECFDFTTADPATKVAFCRLPGVWTAPAVGQQFWADAADRYTASLRDSEQGPVVLATAFQTVPLSAQGSADLDKVLGFHVEARKSCTYGYGPTDTSDPTSIWELTLATTPPVVVKTGGHAAVSVGGRSYDLWVKGSGASINLALAAR